MDRCQEIENLLYDTCNNIFSSKKNMLDFFKFSSNMYKYSFINQVLIYAQKPRATACADMKIWNTYMKCMIKKGTKAISIFDDNADEFKIGYVFDVTDVVPHKIYGTMPKKWEIDKNEILFKKRIQQYFIEKYNIPQVTSNDNLATTVYQLAVKITDKFAKMIYGMEEGTWDYTSVSNYMIGAIASTIIFRLNIEEQEIILSDKGAHYSSLDGKQVPLFYSIIPDNLNKWNIEQKIALAVFTNEFTKNILIDLTKFVRNEERSHNNTRINDEKLNDETELYTEKQLTLDMLDNHERVKSVEESLEDNNDRIYDDRRIPSTVIEDGTESENWEIRNDEKGIFKNTEESNVSSANSNKEIDKGITKIPGSRLEDGTTEQNRRTDKKNHLSITSREEFIEFLTDDRLALIIDNAVNHNANDRIEVIKAIKDFKSESDIKARIYYLRTYFGAFDEVRNHTGYGFTFSNDINVIYYINEKGISITFKNGKDIYTKTLSWQRINMIIDKQHLFASFVPNIKDDWLNEMLLDAGTLSDDTRDILRNIYDGTRSQVERINLINEVMGFDEYTRFTSPCLYNFEDKKIYMYMDDEGVKFKFDSEPAPDKNEYDCMLSKWMFDDYIYTSRLFSIELEKSNVMELYPNKEEVEFSQLSLFDSFAEQQGNISVDNAVSFWESNEISEDQIDEMLRTGAFRGNQKTIMAYYYFDYSPKERIDRLKELYGTSAKGFTFDKNTNITMYYSENGFNFAFGDTAKYKAAKTLTWEEVDDRISNMIRQGLYYIADKETVVTSYISQIEESAGMFLRDSGIYNEFKIDEYIDDDLYNRWGGLSWDIFKEKFSDEKFVSQVKNYFNALDTYIDSINCNYKWSGMYENHGRRKRLIEDINVIAKGIVFFKEPDIANYKEIKEVSFISQDEIDMNLSTGTGFSGGKFRVYKYFHDEKHDLKEKAAFLKKEFGTGGSGGPNCHSVDHDSRGIKISRNSDISICLKWDKVAKRIEQLVKKGRYMSNQEIVEEERKVRISEIIKNLKKDDIISISNGEIKEDYILVQDVDSYGDIIVKPYNIFEKNEIKNVDLDELEYSFTIHQGDKLVTKINNWYFYKYTFNIEKKNPIRYIDGSHIMDNFPLYRKLRDEKKKIKAC